MARKVGKPDEDWLVLVDGVSKTHAPGGQVLSIAISFSPDGKHVAYITRVDNGWTVVVDDVPGTVYERVGGLRFDAPDRLHYEVSKGNEVLVVGECLIPTHGAAPSTVEQHR